MPCMRGKLLYFFPRKSACLIYEVRKVARVTPSGGSPLTWGPAVMHQQLYLLRQWAT